MACMKFTMALTGLKSDVAKVMRPGGGAELLASSARTIAVDALASVEAMAPLAQQGRVEVKLEVGDLTPVNVASLVPDSANRTGFLTIEVSVMIPNELAYNHRAEGSPTSAYGQQLASGLMAVTSGLPDGGVQFREDCGLGVDGPDVAIGSSITLHA